MHTQADELRAALEPARRALWSAHHPHIPYDITLAEAQRGSVVGGKFRLHPDDVAARAARQEAA